MTLPNESLRLGCVKYLNARPLIHGWPEPVDFDTPAALCRKLAGGELDVALVSSFEFLRRPIYTIVDGVAIASDGPVHSVILAHEGNLEAVKEIALDPASQTSVNLLRCLLAERGLHPRFVDLVSEQTDYITKYRARLLIGDHAIRFRQQRGTNCEFWDLGGAWKEATGLPFTFALWLIRPGVPGPDALADRLRACRDENLASLDQVLASETEFSPEFCSHYFRDYLRFGFGEREKEGLLLFRSFCEKHGVLPPGATTLRVV